MIKKVVLCGMLGLVTVFPAMAKQENKDSAGKLEKKPAATQVVQPKKEQPVMMWSVFMDGKTLSIVPIERDGKLYFPIQDMTQFLSMDVRVDSKMRIVDLKTRGERMATSAPYQMKQIKKIAILPFMENTVEKMREDSTIYKGSGEAFTQDMSKLLFEKSLFAIMPNKITTYNWNLNEIKEIGKRLGVEAVLVGRVKRSEFRTDPGFLNDYMVEVIAETVLVETNTGTVVWRQEEGGRNGAFNPLTSGAENRRKRFIRDIVQKASEKMVEELATFKTISE